jgi:hypothetical protein
VLSYHHLKDNPRALRTFTSLDQSEFEILLLSFEVAWNAYIYDNHITKKTRQRRFGGGRKARLASTEDKLVFILMGGDFSWGRAGIAAKTRYTFGIPSQGFQRRPSLDAMPERQHTP